MVTLIDFVLLYTKVEAKNVHDKLTGSLGIFIMAITAVLPVLGLTLNLARARALEAFLFCASKASYFLKKKKNPSTGICRILPGKMWKGRAPGAFLVNR